MYVAGVKETNNTLMTYYHGTVSGFLVSVKAWYWFTLRKRILPNVFLEFTYLAFHEAEDSYEARDEFIILSDVSQFLV